MDSKKSQDEEIGFKQIGLGRLFVYLKSLKSLAVINESCCWSLQRPPAKRRLLVGVLRGNFVHHCCRGGGRWCVLLVVCLLDIDSIGFMNSWRVASRPIFAGEKPMALAQNDLIPKMIWGPTVTYHYIWLQLVCDLLAYVHPDLTTTGSIFQAGIWISVLWRAVTLQQRLVNKIVL